MYTKALIIIYSDGYIDSLEIEKEENHIDYYKKLLLKSEHFKKLCKNCNFEMGIHWHIGLFLARAGAIVFLNWNLKDIVKGTFLVSDIPEFMISFPEKTIANNQLISFEKTVKNYPEEKLEYSKYSSKINGFDSYSYEEILNDKMARCAIILIYPNGDIEEIPVTTHIDHSPYFKENKEKFRNFKELYLALENKNCSHFYISKTLAQNGVIELANFNLLDIANCEEFFMDNLPCFQSYLPETFGSEKQMVIFSKMLTNYKRINLAIYSGVSIHHPFVPMKRENFSIFFKENMEILKNEYRLIKEEKKCRKED